MPESGKHFNTCFLGVCAGLLLEGCTLEVWRAVTTTGFVRVAAAAAAAVGKKLQWDGKTKEQCHAHRASPGRSFFRTDKHTAAGTSPCSPLTHGNQYAPDKNFIQSSIIHHGSRFGTCGMGYTGQVGVHSEAWTGYMVTFLQGQWYRT